MASITITTTPQQDARISPAFGAVFRLGHPANAAEVKIELINYIRRIVQTYEKNQFTGTFVVDPIDPG